MIYFLGIAGFAYYNILSGVLRGMGDSLSALGFLLVAAALNVGLDLWFVAGLGMGVAGVALATVLAQTISAFLCLWKLLRMRDVFDLTLHYLKPCSAPIANIIRIGVPSGHHSGHLLRGHACGPVPHPTALVKWSSPAT